MDKMIDRAFFLHDRPPSGLGVGVQGCGVMSKSGNSKNITGRVLDCYALVHLFEGGGFFESASCSRRALTAGDCFFLFPGEAHSYGPALSDAWREWWVLFDGETIRHFQQKGYLGPRSPVIKAVDGKRLLQWRDAFLRGAGVKNGLEKLPGLLYQVLSELLSSPALSATPLEKVADLFRADPVKKWDLKKMARDQGISYSLFRQRFVKARGMPPYQYLLRERIGLAMRLLADGRPIKRVCEEVGIPDPYHFSRVFKKIAGKPPRAFAKSLREWRAVPQKFILRS